MGGPRASTMRQIYSGTICAKCSRRLPERTDGHTGERHCAQCVEGMLRAVRMDFGRYNGWHATFFDLQAGRHLPRKLLFADKQKLFELVARTHEPAEALRDLERCMTAWGQGSVDLRLMPLQYGKLLVSRR